jgi:hypothetical protein
MSAWVRRADRMISAQVAAYRRELLGDMRGKIGAAVGCPRCGLMLALGRPSLEPRHCPRCLARRKAAVALERLSGGDRHSAPEKTRS